MRYIEHMRYIERRLISVGELSKTTEYTCKAVLRGTKRTCICPRMVAPSLVMITSPSPPWIILSIPRGPRLVRIASATAFAARILAIRTSCQVQQKFVWESGRVYV